MKQLLTAVAIMMVFAVAAVIAGHTEIKKLDAETTTETTTTTTTKIETTTTTETETVSKTTEIETTTETTTLNSLAEQGKFYIGRMYITGYTAEEGFPEGSATASGVGVQRGICAMNRFEMQELGISYGDYLYIEGLGRYQVMDCTADYITNTIDIWVPTNEEAYSITGYREVYR